MPENGQAQDQHHRVRVFVDFWNFTLSMRDVEKNLRTDWSKLGPVLAHSASAVINDTVTGVYQGLNFYGSYDPSKDRKLHRCGLKGL